MERQGLVSGVASSENRLMKIIYRDGTSVQAILMSRRAGSLRIAVSGEEKARTFRQVGGAWMSEFYDPVDIEFDGRTENHRGVSNVTECVCSKQLARQFIAQLLDPEDELPRKDLLYVFCAEGGKVRIQQSEIFSYPSGC